MKRKPHKPTPKNFCAIKEYHSQHNMDELLKMCRMFRSLKALNVDNDETIPIILSRDEVDLLIYFLHELTLYKEV